MKPLSNTPPPKESRELWKHFSDTYFSLRFGLASLAIIFPFVLYLYGKYRHGLDLQPSMSAYFWAATRDQCATFPMRTVFVGFLFAIGVGLYMYKGLTTLENYLLNAASICAAFVAIFPERLSPEEGMRDPRVAQLFENCPAIQVWSMQPSVPIHYMAAVTLFVLLAIVSWACARNSLEYLPTAKDRKRYQRMYKGIAIGMILFPVPGVLFAYLLNLGTHLTFFVEAAGVMTFGLYWAVKTRELALSGLERNAEEAVQRSAQQQSPSLEEPPELKLGSTVSRSPGFWANIVAAMKTGTLFPWRR